MMHVLPSRTRQPAASGVLTSLALAGVLSASACSGSSLTPARVAPGGSSPLPSPTTAAAPTAAATADPAGMAALAAARRRTVALRSYTFRAEQRVSGGPREQVTVIAGRAVRPGSLAYRLTTGASSQDVVKIGTRTYLRVPPAGFKVLIRPTAVVDPLASLLALLSAVHDPHLSGRRLSGTVPAAALAKAGLAPAGASPGASVPVELALDGGSRVTSVAVRLSLRAGSSTLVLRESTAFTGFDRAAAITAPARPRP